MPSMEGAIKRAVEEYNRYRSPEATATLVGLEGERFLIEFRGPFCLSCGVYDYFEDLIYELKRWTPAKFKIARIEERADGSFIVAYEPSPNE